MVGSTAKARAAMALRVADAASSEMRHNNMIMPTHNSTSDAKVTGWVVLTKSTRGVITAFASAARPMGIALTFVGLVWLVMKFAGQIQLWMTAAGVLMVVLSIASAVQEVSIKRVEHQSTASSRVEFDDVEGCTKVITIPTTTATTPAVMRPPLAKAPPKMVIEESVQLPSVASLRRNSCTLELGSTGSRQTLTVVHCGTVIDIQGSRGFIIPHTLPVAKPASSIKLPFVIAFDLNMVLAALCAEITVGKTVEFTFAGDERSGETVLAQNVRPVAKEDELVKSRNALQSCKQVREQSFARAMEELTMISPRNEPIKHHVDLIKYAEHLDDVELPPDQFI